MSAYVDAMFPTAFSARWPYHEACHLLADTEEELVEFAVNLGLEVHWIQRGHAVHFDLTRNKRAQAVKNGAIEVGSRELVLLMKQQRAREAEHDPSKIR